MCSLGTLLLHWYWRDKKADNLLQEKKDTKWKNAEKYVHTHTHNLASCIYMSLNKPKISSKTSYIISNLT